MKHIIYIAILVSSFSIAQNEEPQWLTFEALEKAMLKSPKKVMIHFYADWCAYCKKMEKKVYTKPEILAELNTNYYAVKFNAESIDSVSFGGKVFINLNTGKKRRANHQLAELLATKDGKQLVLPAVLFFNEDFVLKKKLHRYIPPKELLRVLRE